MKEYQKPYIYIYILDTDDVIKTSGSLSNFSGNEEGGQAPSGWFN